MGIKTSHARLLLDFQKVIDGQDLAPKSVRRQLVDIVT